MFVDIEKEREGVEYPVLDDSIYRDIEVKMTFHREFSKDWTILTSSMLNKIIDDDCE